MSRLDWFTIAVVTICIAAILFLLAKTSSLLNNEDNILTDPTSIVDEVTDSDLDDSDIYTDDTMEPEDGDGDGDDDLDPAVSDAEADAAGEDDIEASSDGEDDSSTDSGHTTGKNTDGDSADDEPKVNTSPSGEDAGGAFLVVAGSFQQMINAENFVRKLQGMGYGDASIGKFNAGKYATALAGRFDSRADAKALVDELKEKGIEAYLQIKK